MSYDTTHGITYLTMEQRAALIDIIRCLEPPLDKDQRFRPGAAEEAIAKMLAEMERRWPGLQDEFDLGLQVYLGRSNSKAGPYETISWHIRPRSAVDRLGDLGRTDA